MSRIMRVKIGLCVALATFPFFAFAQSPSVVDLEKLFRDETDRGDLLIKRIEKLEAVRAAKEAARVRPPAVIFRPGVNGVGSKTVSPNFEVTAPTRAIGEQVCAAAEAEWAKSGFPNLGAPCQIRVKVGQIGAGGATTFSFGGGEVFGFDMTVQGSLERILDSVIPHEVCHMKTACNTRRPLPRWADEGIATFFEEYSERRRQWKIAEEVLGTNRAIPISELLRITEYPENMQRVLTLYAEGAVLTEFLISRASNAAGEQWTQEQARRWMVDFLNIAHDAGWVAAKNMGIPEKYKYNWDFPEPGDQLNWSPDFKNKWNSAHLVGWEVALAKKSDQLGGNMNITQLSNEFNKWMKGGKASLYTFKEAPSANPIFLNPNQILPVNNTDQNKYVAPLGR